MLKHLGRFIVFIGIFVSAAVWAEDASEAVRDRDTAPGLYESTYSNAARGVRVADLDPESIRAYFESRKISNEGAAFDLEKGGKQIDGASSQQPIDRPILYVVGVPLFGEERNETLDLVKDLSGYQKRGFKAWLKDLFFLDKKNPETHIRPIGRPTGKWKVLQQFVYPSIWPSDMAPVGKEVLRQGLQSVLISSSIGLTIQLLVQVGERGSIAKALAIVIPAAIVNTAQSAWTSLPRSWWQNYFKRSGTIAAPLIEAFTERSKTSDRISRIFGSIAQQIWMTAFFTFNVYVAGQGNVDASLALVSLAGLQQIAAKKWPSMLMNILWRTPAENALADYVDNEGNLGRGKEGEVESAKIRKILTIVATNLWVYSTLTHLNWEFWGAKWNLGHLGMAALGAAGIAVWAKPKMLRVLTASGRCANKVAALVASKI